MLRVSIIKNGVVTHQGRFTDQLEADSWIALNRGHGSWGKIAGEYPLSFLSEDELSTEISRVTENDFGTLADPLITIPDQFETEILDISVIVEEENLKQKSINAINLGSDLIADIRTLNEKKLEDESMTEQQFTALLADQNALNIERALWNGSLITAKSLIQSFSGYYTTEEKDLFVARIDAFIAQYT